MKPLNIILSGTGGQGILSLTQLIHKLCEYKGLKSQGSTFKGGAQRRGSIHSVIRILPKDESDTKRYSTQIRKGELDVLLSLEQWEALRYQQYFKATTKAYINSKEIPFYAERYATQTKDSASKLIEELGIKVVSKNFEEEAKQLFGHSKMTNYLLLKSAITDGCLPFSLADLTHVSSQHFGVKSLTILTS